MNANRQRMRDVLGAAVRAVRLPGAPLEHPPHLPAATRVQPGEWLARFRAELTTLGGTVREARESDAIADAIVSLIPAGAPRDALLWEAGALPVPGIAEALAARGVQIRTQARADFDTPDGLATLAGASIGVTGAHAALAETGSLVLVSGPGRGRLASLLPPVHVALLERAQLIDSLPSFLAARPECVTMGSNMVVITGPSRTADIEHTLSRGVHGPKEVHVIIVD